LILFKSVKPEICDVDVIWIRFPLSIFILIDFSFFFFIDSFFLFFCLISIFQLMIAVMLQNQFPLTQAHQFSIKQEKVQTF